MSMGLQFSQGMQFKQRYNPLFFVIGMLPLFKLSPAELSALELKLRAMKPEELTKFGTIRQPGNGNRAFYDFNLEACIRGEIPDANTASFPRVTVNQEGRPELVYEWGASPIAEKLPKAEAKETRGSLIRNAEKLLEAVNWTKDIVRKTYESIVSAQSAYIASGDRSQLVSLSLQDIGKNLGVSFSTVSRLLKNKYLVLPDNTQVALRGLLIKGEDVLREKAYKILRPLIAEGSYAKTDEETQKILAGRGIHLARRTVNKYRSALEREKSNGA